MGRILVIGKAERKVVADRCRIIISIEVSRKTAAEASKISGEACENILGELVDLGFKPERIEISNDRIERNTRYNSEEVSYKSEKKMLLRTEADIRIVNRIRRIIEKGYNEVSLYIVYEILDEKNIKKELLKEAIASSRSNAELLAESMGTKVIGIDNANLSGITEIEDLKDETEDEYMVMEQERGFAKACVVDNLSDKVKPEEITLKHEVRIVWLVE